jgi:hypothetical protein
MSEVNEHSLEELEKAYKRKISFAILKDGKAPSRKGLLRNICYLSGLGQWYNSIGATGQGRKGYNRYARLILDLPNKLIKQDIFLSFIKDYITKNMTPYFGDCIFNFDELIFGAIGIEYKSSHVRWHLIDYEMITYHRSNCYENKNGTFGLASIKFETEKTKILNEATIKMAHTLKIINYIDFLENNGYKVSPIES